MQDAFFEWRDEKAERNSRDHGGISFDDAKEAFRDPYGMDRYDADHSTLQEHRFIHIGLTVKGLVFVVYTMAEDRIHIISARKASTKLEKEYEKYRQGKT